MKTQRDYPFAAGIFWAAGFLIRQPAPYGESGTPSRLVLFWKQCPTNLRAGLIGQLVRLMFLEAVAAAGALG